MQVWSSFIALILGFALQSCNTQSQKNPKNNLDPIRVGEVGSMTGSDATFGISTHRGVLLAFEEVNKSGGIGGRKLELISMDDQGKPSEAVLATTRLITQKKVVAILGEVASSLSLAMAPIAQKSRVPMISPSSINARVSQQGDFIFQTCFTDRFQSEVMAQFALKTLKAKRAAILRDIKSDYSRDSSELFTSAFQKGGGEIVIDQTYSAGDIDFRSQLTAIRSQDPDLILAPGYYTEIGLIARQLKELGIKAPLLGGDGWDSPKLQEIGGAALGGSYFVSHFSPEDSALHVQKFVQDYRKIYSGSNPDAMAALAFDAARILVEAMKRTPTLDSTALRQAIAQTRDFEGVTGKITINSNRHAVKSAVVFRLTPDGKRGIETVFKPE